MLSYTSTVQAFCVTNGNADRYVPVEQLQADKAITEDGTVWNLT